MAKKGVIPQIAHQPKSFLVAFFVVFAVTLGFLSMVDALPETDSVAHSNYQAPSGEPVTVVAQNPEEPVRIVAKDIDMNVTIKNPSSTNVEVLDQALLSGAVRYPTSARLGEEGTVLLFGHSSYLPIVHNQAYKAFDGIQTLKKGEVVSVYSNAHEYRYSVVSVRVANATEDVVELSQRGKHLILVTCDSFSTKTSRFVVTLDLVGTYSLSSN